MSALLTEVRPNQLCSTGACALSSHYIAFNAPVVTIGLFCCVAMSPELSSRPVQKPDPTVKNLTTCWDALHAQRMSLCTSCVTVCDRTSYATCHSSMDWCGDCNCLCRSSPGARHQQPRLVCWHRPEPYVPAVVCLSSSATPGCGKLAAVGMQDQCHSMSIVPI